MDAPLSVQQPAPPPTRRIGELDALRGLAAVAVMVFHYTGRYGKDIGHIDKPPFELAMGNYGVQLFFLISGFVIFMTLEKTRTATDFVVSRFSRLYPAYWTSLMLSVLFVYTIGMPDQQLPLTHLVANITMMQELLGFRHLDGVYWTLQIELLFYAQMLFWFLTGQLKRVHWIIALWLVVALSNHLFKVNGVHLSWTAGQLIIVDHIPFFAMGILFYKLYHGESRRLLNHAMIAACIAVIGVVREPVYLPVALICTTVFYLFVFGRLSWLQTAPFTFLGAISYSLYLLHQEIGFDIIWHLEHDAQVTSSLAIAIAIVVSTILATLVTYCVERPVMRVIRKWWQQRRERQEQAAAQQA
jgi:peptidoglycan/LPS O-acetylase OafA/YrhL